MSKLHANKTQEGFALAASLHCITNAEGAHGTPDGTHASMSHERTYTHIYIGIKGIMSVCEYTRIMHRYSCVLPERREAPCRDASSNVKRQWDGTPENRGIKNSPSFKGLIIKKMKLNLYIIVNGKLFIKWWYSKGLL